MSELFQKLNSTDTTIDYVSGSPTFIQERVESFLKFNKFPQAEKLILRKALFLPMIIN
jgi:phosphatidate phosphatase APP1